MGLFVTLNMHIPPKGPMRGTFKNLSRNIVIFIFTFWGGIVRPKNVNNPNGTVVYSNTENPCSSNEVISFGVK